MSYAALTRAYTAVPLALLAYGLGIATGGEPLAVLAAALAIICGLAGGYAYNDLRDQVCDRMNRPARPLVSGQLSSGRVRSFVAISFGSAMILAAATASLITLAFVGLLIFSSVVYSDVIKKITGLKNLFVGVLSCFLPWGASLDHWTTSVLPAIAVVGLFVTQKELVADIFDRDGDRAAGIRTIPVVVGATVSSALLALLNVAIVSIASEAEVVPVLRGLMPAAGVVGVVNALGACILLIRPAHFAVRAYLEVQKALQIGGCLGMLAMITV